MIIKNDSGSMAITVLNYEFPNANPSSEKSYNHDANWLTLQIKYTDLSGQEDIHTENCLLTCELESFRDALRDLLNGSSSQYARGFMEPYLTIETRQLQEKYHMTINFRIHTFQGQYKAVPFSVLLTKEELAEVLNDIETLCDKFPQR